MLLFDGARQHDDLARAARRQRKASLRRAHAGQRPQQPAKPPDLDAQPRAMRFIGELRPEGARHERVPRHVFRPRLGQRAGEREQHRTPRERDHVPAVPAHDMAARVHDERLRRQQRLDLLEQRAGAPRRSRSGAPRACSARAMRSRPPPSAPGCARGAPRARPEPAPRAPASSGGAASRSPRPPARGAVLDAGGNGAGSSSASARSASSRRPIRRRRRTSRYRACAAFTRSPCSFERRPRRVERLRRPAQVARDERDLGLGDDAPRARHAPLSDRRRARRAAGAPSRGRDRRAAPSRCREARAPARRRAGRPASARRADHPPPARAPRP